MDANVSITNGDELGTRTEIKNLGSVKAVQLAIDYEIVRQKNIIKDGKKIVNETRGWDSVNNKTISMRDKEILQVILHDKILYYINILNMIIYRIIGLCLNQIYYHLI